MPISANTLHQTHVQAPQSREGCKRYSRGIILRHPSHITFEHQANKGDVSDVPSLVEGASLGAQPTSEECKGGPNAAMSSEQQCNLGESTL